MTEPRLSELFAERQFMRFWFARVTGTTANQMLMVAVAWQMYDDSVSVVIRQTLMQLETPEDMRGRVGAVNSIFIGASNQLGEFESGATAALFGPVGAVVLGGIGTLFVAGACWKLFPSLAQRDRMI